MFSPRVGGVGERLENAVRERDMENQTIRNGEARFSVWRITWKRQI